MLAAAGAFTPGREALTGYVTINGRRAVELLLRPEGAGPLEVSVPIPPLDPAKRQIDVRIHIDNPRSPREAGISIDSRRLGLFVRSVRIDR